MPVHPPLQHSDPVAAPVPPTVTAGEGRRDPLVRRALGPLALATLGILMARVTMHAADALDNSDTFFHLRLGEEFLGDWSLRDPGRLSAFATSSWLPTQWSTEIVMAATTAAFGLSGLAWLFGALYLAFLVLTYVLCRRQGTPLPSVVATGVVVIAAGASLSARPQVVSLILFTLTLLAWQRAVRTLRPPWLLVPLTWVWATAHGMWTFGVILGVVTCVGIALDRRTDLRGLLRLAAVPLASVLAACLTPVGPSLVTTQLAVGRRTSLIIEWGPTSFRAVDAFLVAAMAGALIVMWSRGHRPDWTELLQVGLGVAWVLLVVRMVPFGALLIAPAFVAACSRLTPVPDGAGAFRRVEPWAVGAIVVACLGALAVAVPSSADREAGVPTRFAERLAALPDGSAVLVEDGTGAWIEWREPGLNPVIDGMLDAYPVDYIADFQSYRALEPGLEGLRRRQPRPGRRDAAGVGAQRGARRPRLAAGADRPRLGLPGRPVVTPS